MEASVYHVKNNLCFSYFSIPKTRAPSVRVRVHIVGCSRRFRPPLTVVKCGEMEGEVGREVEEEEVNCEGEEWVETEGRWRERGVVELMECLEKEAIMGEDEGREPADYNRRAQIFDKISRAFQTLKQTNNIPRNS